MTTKDKTTEEKILEAAHEVFIQKGMDGARTQEIAAKAGINKALLHYYYRTKDMLFLAVFKKVIAHLIPTITDIFNSDRKFSEKIEVFVGRYMSLIMKNPFLPGFVLHEINRNPDKLVNVMKEGGVNPLMFINMVNKAIDNGEIRTIEPRQLIINILALCLFPVVARPLMQRIFFDNNSKEYSLFLNERTMEITDFVLKSIQPVS